MWKGGGVYFEIEFIFTRLFDECQNLVRYGIIRCFCFAWLFSISSIIAQSCCEQAWGIFKKRYRTSNNTVHNWAVTAPDFTVRIGLLQWSVIEIGFSEFSINIWIHCCFTNFRQTILLEIMFVVAGFLVKNSTWILCKYYAMQKLVRRKKIKVYEAKSKEFNFKALEEITFKCEEVLRLVAAIILKVTGGFNYWKVSSCVAIFFYEVL